MKLIQTILLFFIAFCKAQSPVLPLVDAGSPITGAYYKDLDNEFLKFVGTWKYENVSTNTSFTITLHKKTLFYNIAFNYYEDILVGEYKYIENGVEVVNTLPNLNNLYTNEFNYNIAGVLINNQETTAPGNRPLQLRFKDPERDYLDVSIVIMYVAPQGNTPAKIELWWTGDMSIVPDENSPTNIRVPEQQYILTKQP